MLHVPTRREKIGSLFWASSKIVFHHKENTSIIKILLDREQKFYTDDVESKSGVRFMNRHYHHSKHRNHLQCTYLIGSCIFADFKLLKVTRLLFSTIAGSSQPNKIIHNAVSTL